MVRLPEGFRRDPEDAVFGVCFAASLVFGALGWWNVAGAAFALGIGGAIVVDTFWPDGFAETPDTGETADAEITAPDASTADALDTLRNRYARGELDDEEFERRLEALLETEIPEDARRRIERGRGADLSSDDLLGEGRDAADDGPEDDDGIDADDGAVERARE